MAVFNDDEIAEDLRWLGIEYSDLLIEIEEVRLGSVVFVDWISSLKWRERRTYLIVSKEIKSRNEKMHFEKKTT